MHVSTPTIGRTGLLRGTESWLYLWAGEHMHMARAVATWKPRKQFSEQEVDTETQKGAALPALVLQDSSSRAANKEGSTSFTP